MPWRSVLQNVLLPLELRNLSKEDANSQALAVLDLVGLSGFESYLPGDLSGGMGQRVAIARALVHDPDVLLLDEPLIHLDPDLRRSLMQLILDTAASRQLTLLYVTHNAEEARQLNGRVLVLRNGRLESDSLRAL